MANEDAPAFHVGQLVKIITCAHDLPAHMGQVGILGSRPSKTSHFTVYVGLGICQATEVEPVAKDPSVEEADKPIRHEKKRKIRWFRPNT